MNEQISTNQEVSPPQTVAPSPQKPGGSSLLTVWLLVVLIVILIGAGVFYFVYLSPSSESDETSTKTPATKTTATATSSWLVYSIVPAAEEASEEGQAVRFSIDYPSNWNYKVLDEEVKAQGAGTTLHDVAFDAKPKDQISIMGSRLRIIAESKNLESEVKIIEDSYNSDTTKYKKTEGTAGSQKMIKVVDISKTDETNLPVWIFVQSPGSWILTIEGGSEDLATITQMLKTLKF